jgi:DNA-directed RNA polymerase specialized sigma24 family protein
MCVVTERIAEASVRPLPAAEKRGARRNQASKSLRTNASKKYDPWGCPLPGSLVACDRGAAGPCKAVVKRRVIYEEDPDIENRFIPQTVIATKEAAARRCRGLSECPRGARKIRDSEGCRFMAAMESNDRAAVTWALEGVYERTRRWVMRLTDRDDQVDDWVQDTVIGFYQRAPSWNRPANSLIWAEILKVRRRYWRSPFASGITPDTGFVEKKVADELSPDRADRMEASIHAFDQTVAFEAQRHGKQEHLYLALERRTRTSAEIARSQNINQSTLRARESRARTFLVPASIRALGTLPEYREAVVRAVSATRCNLEQYLGQAHCSSFR